MELVVSAFDAPEANSLHGCGHQAQERKKFQGTASKESHGLVNLGDQVWTPLTINYWRVAMNFIVPFCVSAYSAARNQVARTRED